MHKVAMLVRVIDSYKWTRWRPSQGIGYRYPLYDKLILPLAEKSIKLTVKREFSNPAMLICTILPFMGQTGWIYASGILNGKDFWNLLRQRRGGVNTGEICKVGGFLTCCFQLQVPTYMNLKNNEK